MGTWDSGPFDNDSAADFANHLDTLPEDKRAEAIREALHEAAHYSEDDYMDDDIGIYAIAAAALVARELADGARFVSNSPGPKEPLPPLPPELKTLAITAIDRTTAANSELNSLWSEGCDDSDWHRGTRELRAALADE